jgi:hypothetical protein
MSANPEAAAPRLRTVREAWLGRAIERLQADPAISAAGLVGSLGREDADDWSDVDLLIVVPDDQVGHYPDATQLPRPDLVTWSIDARHNAPRGASAIGIDYGIDGLPLHVDWYVYRAPRSPGSQTPGSSSTSRASGAWTRLGQVHVLLDASASRPCRRSRSPPRRAVAVPRFGRRGRGRADRRRLRQRQPRRAHPQRRAAAGRAAGNSAAGRTRSPMSCPAVSGPKEDGAAGYGWPEPDPLSPRSRGCPTSGPPGLVPRPRLARRCQDAARAGHAPWSVHARQLRGAS